MFQVSTNSYHVLEVIPKWSILCFYFRSTFIGLWVIIKWFFFFIWNSVNQSKVQTLKNSVDYYGGFHDKPPSCLVDSKLGRQLYVKLKGVKFHYIESGSKLDPLILLLHGFPDCWLGWHNQIKELSKFFRVVAVDLKGFNDSDKPLERNAYRPKTICEELAQFIKSLGSHSAIIIGHDLGAVIGWIFAHTNPENIDRFISVSAPHPNLMWSNLHSKSQLNDTWLKFVQLPYIPEAELSRADSNFLEKCLVHVYSESKPIKSLSYSIITQEDTPNKIDAYKYVFNRKSDWIGPLNYYRNFPFYKVKEGNVVRCPCLIITGSEDSFCRLESIVKSTEFCDNFIVKIIEGAGHWPHQQMAEEFNKVILKFLVGKRAAPVELRNLDKNNKGLMGRMFGAVSNSVKMGGLVLDSVQQRTNEAIQSALH